MAKSPAPKIKSFSQTSNLRTIILKDPYWRALKQRFPQKYAILEREILKELTQYLQENQFENSHLTKEQYLGMAVEKAYQNPQITQIVQEVYSSLGQANDAAIIKMSEARLHIMNRLLNHNDTACYQWLNQKIDGESFVAAIYEMRLSQRATAEGILSYSPKRPKPNTEQAENNINIVFDDVIKRQNSSLLSAFQSTNENPTPEEQRQFCIVERDVLTQLLINNDINALRHILLNK